jgi:hypothetical protein
MEFYRKKGQRSEGKKEQGREKDTEVSFSPCFQPRTLTRFLSLLDSNQQTKAREGQNTNETTLELSLDPHSGEGDQHRCSFLSFKFSFNSISQVLFTFQSPYLFSIGLMSIFRLTRDSPCIFKQQAQVVLLFDKHRPLTKGLNPL